MPDTLTFPEVETESSSRTQRQPPYAVILHNDDLTSMEWVLVVLKKVFSYPDEKCFKLMMEAHETGRSVAWVGSLEVAELKADQVVSCGPDPTVMQAKEPIRVTVEAMD